MTPSRLNGIDPRIVGQGSAVRQGTRPGTAFREALERELSTDEPVRLSAHARRRLEQSNVSLSDDEKARLGHALDLMGEKGANRSLVLMDSLALVVSVRNRTVITAVDAARAREGAFTNIDSAIIV